MGEILDNRLKIDGQMQWLFDVFIDALVLLEKCDGKTKIIMKNRVYDTLFERLSEGGAFDGKIEAINRANMLFLGEMATQLGKDGSTKTEEYTLKKPKENGDVTLEVCGRLVEEEGGRTLFLFAIKDITERKALEAVLQKKMGELRINEESFRIALRQANLNIWEFDVVENRYIKACRSDDRYPLPDIVEDYPECMIRNGLVHTDSFKIYRQIHERIANGEQHVSGDVHVLEKDGQFHWHRVKYTTIFDDAGKPVRAVGSSENLDDLVMAKKRYEEELCFKQSIIDTTLFYYEVDLTAKKIISTDSRIVNALLLPKGYSMEQMVYYIYYTYINPGEKEVFKKIMDINKIVSDYYEKQIRNLKVEFRARWGDMNTYQWLSMTVRIRESVDNGHLIGFCYIRNINDQKLKILEVEKKAERDELTGLYNRHAFKEKLGKALKKLKRWDESGALFIFDIDAFKVINDTKGHIVGDTALVKMGNVLAGLFDPKKDIIGRLGGDEMIAFMPWGDLEDIVEKGQQICREVQKIEIEGMETQLSCSGGIALIPEHGTEIEVLYERADKALYHAKRNGKNKCSVYCEKM